MSVLIYEQYYPRFIPNGNLKGMLLYDLLQKTALDLTFVTVVLIQQVPLPSLSVRSFWGPIPLTSILSVITSTPYIVQ